MARRDASLEGGSLARGGTDPQAAVEQFHALPGCSQGRIRSCSPWRRTRGRRRGRGPRPRPRSRLRRSRRSVHRRVSGRSGAPPVRSDRSQSPRLDAGARGVRPASWSRSTSSWSAGPPSCACRATSASMAAISPRSSRDEGRTSWMMSRNRSTSPWRASAARVTVARSSASSSRRDKASITRTAAMPCSVSSCSSRAQWRRSASAAAVRSRWRSALNACAVRDGDGGGRCERRQELLIGGAELRPAR